MPNRIDDLKIKRLLLKIELVKQKRFSAGVFSLFNSNVGQEMLTKVSEGKNRSYAKLKEFYRMFAGWDEVSNLEHKSGKYLEELAKNDDSIIAIHRGKLWDIVPYDGFPISYNLNDVMTNGLYNNGHMGVGDKRPAPALTITPLIGLTGLINLIAPYKENDCVIILEIPKTLVDDTCHFVSDESANALYHSIGDGLIRFRPEFIIGAITDTESGLKKYYTKEEIIEANKAYSK